MKRKNKKQKTPGPWWMLRNSSAGSKKDVALTLMIISFVICCVMAIVGSFESISIGEMIIEFTGFSSAFAMSVFGVSAALYFGRRYSENVHHQNMYQTQLNQPIPETEYDEQPE